MKAVIPAAGLGTRLLPATKNSPKEMLPVVDKPTIQYVVEECVASGIRDILIITGRTKRAIEDHFDHSMELEHLLAAKGDKVQLEEMRKIADMADIHFIRQKETKGLGHAVLCARTYIGDEPFALLLGDDIVVSQTPCLKQLLDIHRRQSGSVLAVESLAREQLQAYGVVAPGPTVELGLHIVRDLVEKPRPEDAPSQLGILGRYVLEPQIFEILARTPPGKNGEIQLTDALRELVRQRPIYAWEFKGKRYDVGTKLSWLQTNVEMALMREELSGPFRRFLEEILARRR
jgi:UTP--glucose-1-phosphate uridylyltransferase